MDVLAAVTAVVMDALAVFAGFMLATWVRFDSHWIPLRHDRPDPLYALYALGALFATLVFLLVFRSQDLYERPQIGSFVNKIPRLVRSTVVGVFFTTVLAFFVQNEYEFSRLTIVLSWATITFFVLLERYILFRVEWHYARHSRQTRQVLIIGTDSVAAHLAFTLRRERMLKADVIGFLKAGDPEPDARIAPDDVRGDISTLKAFTAENQIDQIILADTRLEHDRVVDIILHCEQHMIEFNMVPDLFRVITRSMDVQSLDDIPLLGVSHWPLDLFWNRCLKRAEDIAGAALGLVLSLPVLAVAAILIRRESPGPVFYRQERCGEKGRGFTLYKLRTMRVDAEQETGPVFTREEDPRRTRVGACLRRWNLDELPQLWNVLQGDMSLVGPRPERPHFVEQFKADISRYMWRHVSKPGMTGWAQVNGLRGNTSIAERVKYDLYYLENWSLAFDFKILLRTVFARKNAY